VATIIVRPSKIQQGRSAYQRIFLTLASASWSGGTTFVLSGVAGVTKVGQIVGSATQAYVVVTTTGSATGTLTVSDGTNTGTTVVAQVAPTRRKWFPGMDWRRRLAMASNAKTQVDQSTGE
jgi:hypothetical protein